MAQLILESGTGTSSIAKNSRNLYGMKKVGAVEIDGEMYNINRIAENPEAFSAKLENLELEDCIDQLP